MSAPEAWLTATCPACRIDSQAPLRAAGKRARCGDCGTVVRLPPTDGPATIDAGGPAPAPAPTAEEGEGEDDEPGPAQRSGRLARKSGRAARSGSQRAPRAGSERVEALREGREGLELGWAALGGAICLSVILLWSASAAKGDLDGPKTRKTWGKIVIAIGGTLGMAGSGLVSVVTIGGAVGYLVHAQGARNRAVATHGKRRRS